MTTEQLDTLVSWLRKQAEDGAHQPPSYHGQRCTEAADYIESTRRAAAASATETMTAARWGELKLWLGCVGIREGYYESIHVADELDRARASEVALRAELDELKRSKPACGNQFMAHVCIIKRDGHSDLHGDGDGGEWAQLIAELFRARAAESQLRMDRDAATAQVEEAERSYIEESSRNCEAERELRDALLNVLSSATPHPVEHPTMWRTWRQANVLLGRDPDTHVIPTSDKKLEQRIMSGGRP